MQESSSSSLYSNQHLKEQLPSQKPLSQSVSSNGSSTFNISLQVPDPPQQAPLQRSNLLLPSIQTAASLPSSKAMLLMAEEQRSTTNTESHNRLKSSSTAKPFMSRDGQEGLDGLDGGVRLTEEALSEAPDKKGDHSPCYSFGASVRGSRGGGGGGVEPDLKAVYFIEEESKEADVQHENRVDFLYDDQKDPPSLREHGQQFNTIELSSRSLQDAAAEANHLQLPTTFKQRPSYVCSFCDSTEQGSCQLYTRFLLIFEVKSGCGRQLCQDHLCKKCLPWPCKANKANAAPSTRSKKPTPCHDCYRKFFWICIAVKVVPALLIIGIIAYLGRGVIKDILRIH